MAVLKAGQFTKEERELDEVYLETFKNKLRQYADAIALAGYVNGWDDGSDGTVQGSYSQEGYISMPVLRTHINENEEVIKAYNKLIKSFADYAARLKTVEFFGGMDTGYEIGYLAGKNEIEDFKKLSSLTDIPINEIGFSTRATNILVRSGYTTLEDLRNATQMELMGIKTLGKRSIEEIVTVLKNKYGIDIPKRR